MSGGTITALCQKALRCTIAATLLAVGVAKADQAGGPAVAIPEPLVFDLVRGLGAKRGEFEANVLAEVPLNHTNDRDFLWAPEIEGAILDGVALEFEVPFEGNDLEAYKAAVQFTFGTGFEDSFIHGSQFIVEEFDHDDLTELTALYLAGVRFNESWSALAMLGYRWHDGGDAPEEDDWIFNVSVFRNISHSLTFGVENDYVNDGDGHWELLVMPQLHHELTEHVELQWGVGVELTSDENDVTAALRLIYSR